MISADFVDGAPQPFRLFEFNPNRRMIARARLTANPLVDPCVFKPLFGCRIQQNMVDAQAGVGLPVLTKIIPEGVNLFVRKVRANRIGPALREQALIAFARFGLQQRVFSPRTRIINIEIRRHDIVIAGEHTGCLLVNNVAAWRMKRSNHASL